VERLDEEGRLDEIARMIGGATVTAQTRASAGELLAASHKDRAKAKGERRKRN
jgi:DNA repair ATPase RecN